VEYLLHDEETLKNIRRRRTGQFYDVWRRFKKNRASLVGGTIVLGMVVLALLAPLIAPYNPTQTFHGEELSPPSSKFLLGTDLLGRDMLSYIIYGARTSLLVALGGVTIEILLALLIGGFGGYFGGYVDELLSRFSEIVMTMPTLILLITAVAMFRVRSILLIMIIMGLLGWPWMARVIRAQFYSLKEQTYVESARSMGFRDRYIIFHHILPNALSSIIVLATLDAAYYILYEATLSFLGLGDPLAISWGILVSLGRKVIRSAWWVSTIPGLMIFLIVMALNLLGDGLRDALDVRAER